MLATETRKPSALFAGLYQSHLSVIVPVFNESKNIRTNLELLIAEVEPYFLTYEVLVVNDGSTDSTTDALLKFTHPRVRPIVNPTNKGKGYAVREGFKQAKGDYILFIDGGIELRPKDIRIFLGLMELYDADVVLGSKRHPESKIDYPVIRRILSFIYQMLVRKLFRLDVTDTQVGIKLFKRKVVQAILPDLTIDRYGFDLEILALAKARGFTNFLEAPIRLDYFHIHTRPFFREILHIGKVGTEILKDTLRLYRKIRAIPPGPGRQ